MVSRRTPGVSPITAAPQAGDPGPAPNLSDRWEGGVRAAVEHRLSTMVDVDEARAAVALVLAQALDDGAGLSTAAVSRELRACLSELEAEKGDNAEIRELITRLRLPAVGNTKIG